MNHIFDAKNDPEMEQICEAILESGDRIIELLRAHGGLIEPMPPPAAFTAFLLHHQMLKMSWDKEENQDPETHFPFPGKSPERDHLSDCTRENAKTDLDCAIWLGMSAATTDLEILLGLQKGDLSFDGRAAKD